MTDREVGKWAGLVVLWGEPRKGAALRELLAYRRAARRLRKAYGKFGPGMPGALIPAACEILAVGRPRPGWRRIMEMKR